MLVGNKNVQEITLLHELEQEFSEVIFKLTPVMKAKDARYIGTRYEFTHLRLHWLLR